MAPMPEQPQPSRSGAVGDRNSKAPVALSLSTVVRNIILPIHHVGQLAAWRKTCALECAGGRSKGAAQPRHRRGFATSRPTKCHRIRFRESGTDKSAEVVSWGKFQGDDSSDTSTTDPGGRCLQSVQCLGKVRSPTGSSRDFLLRRAAVARRSDDNQRAP